LRAKRKDCTKCPRKGLTEDDFYHDGERHIQPCKQCRRDTQIAWNDARRGKNVEGKVKFLLKAKPHSRARILFKYIEKKNVTIEDLGQILREVSFKEEITHE
jgi:hypothetical protein